MRILILAALIFFRLDAKPLDRVVAVVQGKAILLSDVQELRSQIQKSSLLGTFYKIDGGITDQSVLNRLVEDQIVRARLKELGTEVTGDTVNREVAEIARKNQLTTQQLRNVLKKQEVDFDNYFDALRSQIERRIIYHREISATALTDDELKTVYRTKAPPEFKISMIIDAINPKNKKILDEIASGYKAKKVTEENLKEHPGYVDLGWMAGDEVAEQFKKEMAKAKPGDAVGPVKKDGKYQLLFVAESRRGSDESFEKIKDRFRGSEEEAESEKKFKTWFEKQKNQLEVTVNPI